MHRPRSADVLCLQLPQIRTSLRDGTSISTLILSAFEAPSKMQSTRQKEVRFTFK
jgi:hypothetical protein